MLRDGYYMSPNDAQEELEEVQSDLKKREDEVNITREKYQICFEQNIIFLFFFLLINLV